MIQKSGVGQPWNKNTRKEEKYWDSVDLVPELFNKQQIYDVAFQQQW